MTAAPSDKQARLKAYREAYGVLLRQAREQAGQTQEELAFAAELDLSYISLLERGKRAPTIGTIHEIALALNTTASTMVALWETEFLPKDPT